MESRIAFLFTGQGSQYVGMGRELYDAVPAAREIFDRADAALGLSISRVCFEGPEEELGITINTQPATLTMSYAAYKALGVVPRVAAGHSLGEYTAVAASGAIAFEDAVRLVRKRGEVMSSAMPPGKGGMAALRRMSMAEVEDALSKVTRGKATVANINCPGQIVVSGDVGAIEELCETLGRRSAFRLPVSAAFHSAFMKPAEEAFRPDLKAVVVNDPAFPVYSNVDAVKSTEGAEIRDALIRQICGQVRWQETVEKMITEDGIDTFVELGPKKALQGMVETISEALGRKVRSLRVENCETLAEARGALVK